MFHESTTKRMSANQNARKTKPNLALEPSASRLWTRLGREVLRLVWLTASVFLFLALASYSAKDPSWSTWSSNAQYHNWMGRSGSVLADIMIQSLGAGSLLAVFLMWVLFPHLGDLSRPMDSCFKRIRIGMAWIFSCSVVLQIFLPKNLCPWELNHSGGAIGFAIEQGLVFMTGKPGAGLGAILLCAVFSVLFFEREILCALQRFLQKSAVVLVLLFKSGVLWLLSQAKKVGQAIYRLKDKVLPKKQQEISITEPVPAFSAPAFSMSMTEPVLAPVTTAVQIPLPPEVIAPKEISDSVETSEPTEEHPDKEIFKLAAPKVPKPVKDFSASTKNRRKNDPFRLPSLQLLSGRRDNQVKTVDRTWYVEKSQLLVQKLKDFGVDGEVVHISPGPVITVFEFKPASGVKIKEIANLSDDLTLALSVLSVRIVAPIPGKPVVGIEIPTPYRQTVYFKDMLEETPFFNSEMKIPVVLGRLASGEPVVTGLASMPHLLVAGSTGTGKSVFINNLICSLLYRYTPEQLKLILVDPKMVELSSYEGIPHLMLPVVVDSRKAALTLRWVVDEMERRYALMHQSGVRHVDAYNDKRNAELAKQKSSEEDAGEPLLPYIVVVIDEYADLMAVVPKDVELSIARLAQKARASGIHLVLATQRPSTDVVTGTIKANFPSRISFRVASSIDSKTILDRTGADRLLGNGDMLFHSAGFTTLKRIQGAFLSDADIEGVVEFLKSQGEPEYDERLLNASLEADVDLEGETSAGDASLYDKAVRLVTEKGEASISLIQRHLKIGYNRAASLMEELEKEGVVGGSSGNSKRRQVLVNSL